MITNDSLPTPINNKGQVVISTETRRGRTLRLLPLVIFSCFAAFASILACFALPSLDYRGALVLIAINMLFPMIGLAEAWRARWGTWVLDDQGLEFHPCSGPPRRLSWNDVVLILWGRGRAVFRGASTRIAIPWCHLSSHEVAVAKGIIERKLHDAFDLSDYFQLHNHVDSLKSISGIVRMSIISMVTALIWVGGFAMLDRWLELSADWRPNFGKAWTIFALFVWVWASGWLNGTTARKLHRDWPWRARRTASDRSV